VALCGSSDRVGVDLYAACRCQLVRLAVHVPFLGSIPWYYFPDFSSVTIWLNGNNIGLPGGSSAVYSLAAGQDYVAKSQAGRCLYRLLAGSGKEQQQPNGIT